VVQSLYGADASEHRRGAIRGLSAASSRGLARGPQPKEGSAEQQEETEVSREGAHLGCVALGAGTEVELWLQTI
jgi:hypothetical protein